MDSSMALMGHQALEFQTISFYTTTHSTTRTITTAATTTTVRSFFSSSLRLKAYLSVSEARPLSDCFHGFRFLQAALERVVAAL